MKSKLKLAGVILEKESGEKVELSIDEAKELHQSLDEIFGSKPSFPSIPYPVIIDPHWDRYPRYWPWVTYDTQGTGKNHTLVVDLDYKERRLYTKQYLITQRVSAYVNSVPKDQYLQVMRSIDRLMPVSKSA